MYPACILQNTVFCTYPVYSGTSICIRIRIHEGSGYMKYIVSSCILLYPWNTLGYTSGYNRRQKYMCIHPRTPECMTDYRIQQDASRIHASSPRCQNTQSACIPSSSRSPAGTCSLALLPDGKEGGILLIAQVRLRHRSSQHCSALLWRSLRNCCFCATKRYDTYTMEKFTRKIRSISKKVSVNLDTINKSGEF